MDSFSNAKEVRLFSHHLKKFIHAHEDEKSIILHPPMSPSLSKQALWIVEVVDTARNTVRLKSCHGTYLTACDMTSCCLGVKKVIQTKVVHQGVEWEPVAAIRYVGNLVKLKTGDGNFLQANRGIGPLCDFVTHNVPRQDAPEDSILWDVQWSDNIPS